jgi:ankyrin repeat protein
MNIRMTTTRTKTNSLQHPDNLNLIYYLSIGNIHEIKNHINETNVDNVIDDKNRFTALHYAIKFGDKEIINYLLGLKASITKKTATGEDAIDLSFKYHNKDVINATLIEKNTQIKNLQKDIDLSEKKRRNLESNNSYLVKSVDNLVEKNDNLKFEINVLQDKNKELDEGFNKLKRKYSSLETSYEGLLNNMRK